MADPLGRVNVEIGADTSKLKQGVQEANNEVGKLDKQGKSLGKTMQKAQEVMSRIFIPVAVAGAVAGVTQKVLTLITSVQNLRIGFQETEKAARSLVDNARLDQLTKDAQEAVKVMRAFDSQIDAVRQQAEEFKASTAGFWLGVLGVADADALAAESIRNIQIAQMQAERELSKMRLAEAQKVERDRIALARKSAGDLFNAIDDIEIDLLPEPEAILRRYELGLLRIQDRLKEQGIFNERDVQIALQNYTTFLNRKRDADLEALREREKAEREAGERTAKANADAMEREFRAAFERLNTSFGFNASGLNNIVGAINGLRTEVQRRRN